MGDPTGIGPEIVIKAISDPEVLHICEPVIIGDERIFMDVIKTLEAGSLNPEVRIKNLSNFDSSRIEYGTPHGMELNQGVDLLGKEVLPVIKEYIHQI